MNEMIFVHAYTIETETNIFGQIRQVQIPKGEQHLFDEVKTGGKKTRSAYALCGLAAADIGAAVKETQKRIYLPICKDCEKVFKTRNNSARKKWTEAAAEQCIETPAKIFHDLVEEAVNKRIDDDWLKRARVALSKTYHSH